jgi:hypothetical protein
MIHIAISGEIANDLSCNGDISLFKKVLTQTKKSRNKVYL